MSRRMGKTKKAVASSLWASSAIDMSRTTFDAQWNSKKRAVMKNGDFNVSNIYHAEMKNLRKFMMVQDVFTTLINLDWPWILLIIFILNVTLYTIFGLFWWYVSQPPRWVIKSRVQKPCVNKLTSYVACFLFSIEVAYGIGFGDRAPTSNCLKTFIMLCVEILVFVYLKGTFMHLVFSKLGRPSASSSSIIFSRFACISFRDGELCLTFRIANIRRSSHFVAASVRAVFLRRKVFHEGEDINPFIFNLPLNSDGANCSHFLWPITAVHSINSASPLYNMTAADLRLARFEIIVIVNGASDSTGRVSQARISYILTEILWGYRFVETVLFDRKKKQYSVDYGQFDSTERDFKNMSVYYPPTTL